ncbi:MAG: hypothetical protein R3D62_12825 [Xanthobacteraceae bacterium]
MKTVTLQIARLDEVKQRARRLSRPQARGAYQFCQTGASVSASDGKAVGPDPLLGWCRTADDRGVARRLKRDVKAVHGDVKALLAAGITAKTENGHIVFPFDAIRIDVILRAA